MKIVLKDAIKTYSKGQDKLIPPSKTIQNALLAMSKIQSLASVKLEQVDHLDRIGIPVFRSHVLGLHGKKERRSYGKGVDSESAKASALMELVERFSAGKFEEARNNFKTQSYSAIRGNKIALENLLFCYEDCKKECNYLDGLKEVPLEWTDSFSLTQNKIVRLPLKWFWWVNGSNGMAAGNSIEEAILQALCEVVERHVQSIIIRKGLRAPMINVNSINNALAKDMILKFNKAGIKLFIKDFSLGIGIPSVGVLAYDSKTPFKFMKIIYKVGTSLNRDTALIRALIETAQARSACLYQNKIKSIDYLVDQDYRELSEAKPFTDNTKIINFSDLPTYSNKNFKKEIEIAVRKLADNGFEVIVTNVSHGILKIPVVIVTIPGNCFNIDRFDPFLFIAQSYVNAQDYRKCIDILEKNFKLYPEAERNIEKLFLYGTSYQKIKKYTEAIKIFNHAVSFCEGKDIEMLKRIFKALASCYLNLSKPDEALRIYKEIRRLQEQG